MKFPTLLLECARHTTPLLDQGVDAREEFLLGLQ